MTKALFAFFMIFMSGFVIAMNISIMFPISYEMSSGKMAFSFLIHFIQALIGFSLIVQKKF